MTETLLLTTLFATQWIIVSQNHRKGVRTLLFFKKCKLLCCYDFFYLRHANLRKMGCGLTSSRSCLKVLMMIMMWCPSLMSRAKTKIPLTVHCLLINWLGSGLAGLNNFSNDEEVLTLVFSLLVVSQRTNERALF